MNTTPPPACPTPSARALTPAPRRWRRCLPAALGLLAASACCASAAPQDSADCERDGAWARTLVPAAQAPALPARAAWVDGRTLIWPQPHVAGSRYALLASPRAALVTSVGQAAQGATTRLALDLVARDQAAPPAQSQVGRGLALRLREGDHRRLAQALRGELRLVQEDAQGRVRAATGTQLAAALDALYADAAEALPLGAWVQRPDRDAPLGPRRPAPAPSAAASPPSAAASVAPVAPAEAVEAVEAADDAAGVSTQFRLWAPTAHKVALCLHEAGAGSPAQARTMARDPASGSWALQRPGDLSGHAYRYLVDVVVPGVGLVRNRVTDPYALALTADSTHAVVADLASPALAPPGWGSTPAPDRVRTATDLVVYELHVRDFSVGDTSVPEAWRGKYEAFTVTGSQGMRHLRQLADAGVTDVHLLPVFDFATVPETGCVTPALGAAPAGAPDGPAQQDAVTATKARDCFNWGYDPLHYTAPEGSYAADPTDPLGRILSFRRMVHSLHALGLRVGMDVVYNHTSAAGQHPQAVLDRIVPGYYHRLDGAGRIERSTCCDNTATEHRMMARLMVDSAVVWARDHHIDSFRFDLMGHQPRAVMERLQRAVNAAAGRHVHLIGEGWNFGEVADGARFVQASQHSLAGSGIASFSDRARDAIRGGSVGDAGADQLARQGLVNGLHLAPNPHALASADTRAGSRAALLRAADLVRVGLAGTLRGFSLTTADGATRTLAEIDYAGQPAGYAAEPGEVVNYVENHDNQTLFDLNVFKLPPATPAAERARVQHLASSLVLLSQGVAYLHAGQEILRSKSLDRNSYDSGDWFNPLDWSLQDNGFGRGLPPAQDNRASWPLMQPLLARAAAIRPDPATVAWTRDALLDMLRVRASTTLLRLPSAAEVRQRLRFHNTGPQQLPGVIVGELDGRSLPGAGFDGLLYAVNAGPAAVSLDLPALRGQQGWRLHPVLARPQAADARARQAHLDPASARLDLPGRTVVVLVR